MLRMADVWGHMDIAVRLLSVLSSLSLLLATATTVLAQQVPHGFTLDQLATLPNVATSLAVAPDGAVFVTQQSGEIHVIRDGQLLPTLYTRIPVIHSYERGLLGIAFSPTYTSDRYIYLFYTDATTTSDVIGRVQTNPANPNQMLAGSLTSLLTIAAASNGMHHGGGIAFGRDGMLYVGVGDGQQTSNSQSLATLQGKVLRLDVRGSSLIPADNPFTHSPNARPEIWALGLRNPFSLAADPVSGSININDVGGGRWEEINRGLPGANYGWPTCEGNCNPPNSLFTNPLYAYDHANGNCAITAGAFYRGTNFPSGFGGRYFFADYCTEVISVIDQNRNVTPFASDLQAVAMTVTSDGHLLVLHRPGQVFRIRHTGQANRAPVARLSASPTVGRSPLAVSFDGRQSSDPDNDPLTFSWDFGDGSAVQAGSTAAHTYTRAGSFNATLTVSDGRGGQHSASLPISSGNNPPAGTITSPAETLTFRGGSIINYSGTATDTEDGPLPASAFSWTISLHHDQHSHPFLGPINGVRSGSFTVPTLSETSPNIWYRISMTVRDSNGAQHTTFRDIHPQLVTIRLVSIPSGLTINLDGQPVQTPHTLTGVVGIVRTLAAPSPQSIRGGHRYTFVSWSDGGFQAHNISSPSTNTTYTATFRELATHQTPEPTPTVSPTATPQPTATPTPTAAPTVPIEPTPDYSGVAPRASCVDQLSDGSFMARFSYESARNGVVDIPAGDQNRLVGQVAPATLPVSFAPGISLNVVAVNFVGSAVTWKLGSYSATALATGARCCNGIIDQCGVCNGADRCLVCARQNNPVYDRCGVCGGVGDSCLECITISSGSYRVAIRASLARLARHVSKVAGKKGARGRQVERVLSAIDRHVARLRTMPLQLQSCSNSELCQRLDLHSRLGSMASLEMQVGLLLSRLEDTVLYTRINQTLVELGHSYRSLPRWISRCSS